MKDNSLDELDFEEKAATAIKWPRLYGGALMVMIIDDGGELTDSVNWDDIRGIDELMVFERPLVTPDYSSIYQHRPDERSRSVMVSCIIHQGGQLVMRVKNSMKCRVAGVTYEKRQQYEILYCCRCLFYKMICVNIFHIGFGLA